MKKDRDEFNRTRRFRRRRDGLFKKAYALQQEIADKSAKIAVIVEHQGEVAIYRSTASNSWPPGMIELEEKGAIVRLPDYFQTIKDARVRGDMMTLLSSESADEETPEMVSDRTHNSNMDFSSSPGNTCDVEPPREPESTSSDGSLSPVVILNLATNTPYESLGLCKLEGSMDASSSSRQHNEEATHLEPISNFQTVQRPLPPHPSDDTMARGNEPPLDAIDVAELDKIFANPPTGEQSEPSVLNCGTRLIDARWLTQFD